MTAEEQLAKAILLVRISPYDPSVPFDEPMHLLARSFERFMDECLVMDRDLVVRLRRLVLCRLVADTVRARCGDLSLLKGVAWCR